jgi:8-oxo-dGTP pyrophosphatase MutT (NUDIX family)
MIKQLSTKIVYQNPWMIVREDEVEFANHHRGIFGVVDKADFALIIPFDGHNFHLVKQYRYPIHQWSIEFPQGKHEEVQNESADRLAQAELLEETGLKAGHLEHLGFFHEAPGYSNQGFHIFLATDLTQSQKRLDITEVGLESVTFTAAELETAIIIGKITDAPTISAYGLWKMTQNR